MSNERLINREGLVEVEWVRVRCPACGQRVLAVAGDGRVRGYCAVAKRYVDFVAETPRIGIASVRQDPEVKDVVSDYLRGDQISVIQLRYGVSPEHLRDSHVKLRKDRKPK